MDIPADAPWWVVLLAPIVIAVLRESFPKSGMLRRLAGRTGQSSSPSDLALKIYDFHQKSAAPFAIVDSGGRPIYVNQALADFLGYSTDFLRRTPFVQFTEPQWIAVDTLLYERFLRTEIDGYALVKSWTHSDGHAVWGELVVWAAPNGSATPYACALIRPLVDGEAPPSPEDPQFRILRRPTRRHTREDTP